MQQGNPEEGLSGPPRLSCRAAYLRDESRLRTGTGACPLQPLLPGGIADRRAWRHPYPCKQSDLPSPGAASRRAHFHAFAVAREETFGGILRGWPDVRLPLPGEGRLRFPAGTARASARICGGAQSGARGYDGGAARRVQNYGISVNIDKFTG